MENPEWKSKPHQATNPDRKSVILVPNHREITRKSLENSSTSQNEYFDYKSIRTSSESAKYSDEKPKDNNKCNDEQPDRSPTDKIIAVTLRGQLAALAQICEDWLYLALLGIIMALISFSMDTVITLFLGTRLWLFQSVSDEGLLVQFISWCLTPIVLVSFSTGFVQICSPTAIGSGIPEMKTILRGVVLNEYLTFRTLVAKIVGLTCTLSSGLPLGKEGPFVHMASIVATLLSKLVASFQGIYENESRASEMLSAACAVGVAATFYAPIGGVLFSIEVTTVYFAVRNYWRGFFAACCGATIWRLLGFWIKNDESISALFKTNFNTDYPFDPIELLVFSLIGATCGLAGAGYIKFHREIVQFFRRHKKLSEFLQENRFVYPILVTFVITSSTFPPFIGKYTASTLSTHTTIQHLFSNRTWSLGRQDLHSNEILDEWTTEKTDFYFHLVMYIVMLFWTSALASTIPIPSGMFIPVLKMGAAYGRLLGELMHLAFPQGIRYGAYPHSALIVPGSYAVVGAAAFSGAVTHTISTSVILFEMTGQIVHIIPVILGVLIANAVCQSLQPSIYDSIIEIKKLPYLPPIASSNSVSHRIVVRDFMNTNLAYVWKDKCTLGHVKALLISHKKLLSFPLVESPRSMKLLGSLARSDLLKLLYIHLGRERRLQEVSRRTSETHPPLPIHLVSISTPARSKEKLDNGDLKRRPDESDDEEDDDDGEVEEEEEDQLDDDDEDDEGNSDDERGNRQKKEDDQPEVEEEHSKSQKRGSTFLIGGRIGSKRGGTGSNSSDSSDSSSGSRTSSGGRQQQQQQTKPEEEEEEQRKRRMTLARRPSSQLEMVTQSECDGIRERSQLGAAELVGTSEVAKMVNHYDRGSRMEKSLLEAARSELVWSQTRPEMGESMASGGSEKRHLMADRNSDRRKSSGNKDRLAPAEFSLRTGSLHLTRQRTRQSLSLVPVSAPQSPSLSSRPFKSILKPSPSSIGMSNMYYKRNLSSSRSLAGSALSGVGGRPLPVGNSSTNVVSISSTLGLDREAPSLAMGPCSAPPPEVGTTPPSGSIKAKFSIENGFVGDTGRRRRVRLPQLRVVDMTPDEQEAWEKEQLNAYIELNRCQVDEAPFQLVEQTSLYRVHTLFSMLGLNHAYVTSFGRLVGIVALKDIRCAIEHVLQERR